MKNNKNKEVSVKSGDSIIFDGRKGTFIRHAQPGRSVFIEVDDEFFETSVNYISMDPNYDYTEKTSNAVNRIK